jgi:hypothetical protein
VLTTLPPSVSQLSRENVRASTSHNPMGLTARYMDSLILPIKCSRYPCRQIHGTYIGLYTACNCVHNINIDTTVRFGIMWEVPSTNLNLIILLERFRGLTHSPVKLGNDHFLTKTINIRKEFLTLYPAKCLFRDEAPNSETEDMIVSCLLRALAHFREGGWNVDQHRRTEEAPTEPCCNGISSNTNLTWIHAGIESGPPR